MSIRKYIDSNTPSYRKNSERYLGLYDAAAEFLTDTEEAIKNLDYAQDYKKSTPFFYENRLKDLGYQLPTRLPEEKKRMILRDISELIMKNGTIDSITQALKLVGVRANVRVGWIPSPRNLRRGYYVDPVTRELSRKDINRYFYVDMLYGEEVETEEGTMFYGYKYSDVGQENELGPFPIIGENYTEIPENDIAVAKSPYIVVGFDESSFVLADSDDINPESGEVFTYSTSEEFELVNDILRFFLVQNKRPTTTRIAVIVTFQTIEDILDVEEEFVHENPYFDDGGDTHEENLSAEAYFDSQTTVTVPDLEYGAGYSYGVGTFGSPFTFLPVGEYGLNENTLQEEYDAPAYTFVTYQRVGYDFFPIPLRGGTSVSFFGEIGNEITVIGDRLDGGIDELQVVIDDDEFTFSNSGVYSALRFESLVPLVQDLVINISHPAVNGL